MTAAEQTCQTTQMGICATCIVCVPKFFKFYTFYTVVFWPRKQQTNTSRKPAELMLRRLHEFGLRSIVAYKADHAVSISFYSVSLKTYLGCDMLRPNSKSFTSQTRIEQLDRQVSSDQTYRLLALAASLVIFFLSYPCHTLHAGTLIMIN